MHLSRYLDDVERQLSVTADGGDDATRAAADRLLAVAGPAVRLALLDALGDAATEITTELAPGSVELRLRGREPEFVVTPPPSDRGPVAPGQADGADDDLDEHQPAVPPTAAPAAAEGEEDEELARINLRLPKTLKQRVEQAAARDGISINAWLVRAVSSAAEPAAVLPPAASGRRTPRGGQRFTGWVR